MSVAFESTQAAPAKIESQVVETPVVACDGGPLGHPRIFLNLAHEREATCPYCSKHFVLAEGAKVGGH